MIRPVMMSLQYDPEPLPQTFNGRFRAFLFSLGITLLCGFVGAGIIWAAFEETGFQMVLMFFFGLWPLLVSGLFLYLSFYFTWRLTLLPDKIVLRCPFHQQEIPVASLASLRVLTIKSNRSPAPSLVLVLTMANGRSHRISQLEMPLPIPQLLAMMIHHYQLPFRYEKEAENVHHTAFGAGSRRPFTDYLNGESRVTVQSLDDICRWLQQCEYVRDSELFGQRDVWQHPGEFETRRQGDCEDHALWAWRKLRELNIPAEFVVGRVQWGDVGDGAHAWVAYEENGRSFILESTHKKQLIYPLEAIQSRYHPWFGVDTASQTYRFVPVAARSVNGNQ
ncbi:MAG: transglutaminase domain-containing protein [Ardenticatenaceae bacterium]|nr:transglutaminase domain-containing protein [Anaerolineales bacterium]MCB8941144.1 transglutaminase domain-containing protein [Ardenticatenaceae bacterium]MCB8972485.1 transglutaminase domain-containing protein [Ardenticatenaceae bacterium]